MKSLPALPQPTLCPQPHHSLGARGRRPSWGRAIGHRKWLEGQGTVGGEGQHGEVSAPYVTPAAL